MEAGGCVSAAECGRGEKNMTRRVITEAKNGGLACSGPKTKMEPCHKPCPKSSISFSNVCSRKCCMCCAISFQNAEGARELSLIKTATMAGLTPRMPYTRYTGNIFQATIIGWEEWTSAPIAPYGCGLQRGARGAQKMPPEPSP